MRASTITWGLTLAMLALAGCPSTTFESDDAQLRFEEPGLTSDAWGGFDNSQPVLAGTAICPAIECNAGCPDGWEDADLAAACFEQAVEGDATLADSCLILEGPGDASWQFDPTPCEANDDGYAPVADQVVFRVADPASLLGRVDQWPEDVALGGLAPAPGATFPTDLRMADGEPFRVLADQEVVLFVELVDPASDEIVAWRSTEGRVEVTASSGSVEITDDSSPGWIALRLANGAEATLGLVVGDTTWEATEVIAVSGDAPASVELVAAMYPGEDLEPDADYHVPWGARAVVRDGDGHTVYGAPIDWKISSGALQLDPGPWPAEGLTDRLPGADYAYLADTCEPPSKRLGDRSAQVQACYRDTCDEVDLDWIVTEDTFSDSDEDWQRPASCDGSGCSCRQEGSTASGAARTALLAAGAGVLVRRRLH